MPVKTTLNLQKKIKEKIISAAEATGKSRSEIVILLLMKVMKNDTKKAAVSGAVKYQEKDKGDVWKKLHVSYREDEYEYFTDLRKVLKESLSLVLTKAVKKYLDEIIYNKDSDNYQFQNYIISRETANGVIFWKILWGLPRDIEKFIQLN